MKPSEAEEIELRAAAAGDAGILLEWVNAPESLRSKLRTTEPVGAQTHRAWFAERLADPGTEIWIAEREGTPIGQVRLQLRESGLEVDIYVVPALRRRGVAQGMLDHAIEQGTGRWPGKGFVARVRTDNLASRGLFEAAGFELVEELSDHVVLARRPGG